MFVTVMFKEHGQSVHLLTHVIKLTNLVKFIFYEFKNHSSLITFFDGDKWSIL